MPPKGSKLVRTDRESSIERTEEYEAFIKKLEEYHEKRGTTFDPEPKVGSRHLNLLAVYKRILEEGGYDVVSDTKAKPLMWRKLAEEFIGKGPYLAAQAFQVKSAYYKNLGAFEISDHWKEDPPPKEILEDVTAKGGNIRGRTLENFMRPGLRDGDKRGGDESESDENKSPKDEDDAIGATGRSTRGLRHAPPQRVLFQPDINSGRQSRSAAVHNASPSPGIGNLSGYSHPTVHGTNITLANYEPRAQLPLTLRPVPTPANNPEYFSLKRKQLQDAAVPAYIKRYKGVLLPGTGFIGPNIYVRAQLALQSGIPDEERYALHHLVKISHERGDKYRFDQFPGLAEALVKKVLQISSLFYNVDWTVDYTTSGPDGEDVLDGIRGNPNVLSKLQANVSLDLNDSVQSSKYYDELSRITEAALIIRNMVMLEENAQYVARLPLMRDYATIALNLDHPSLDELQMYTLEIIEQTSLYCIIDSKSPLYVALLQQIQGEDRGKIITALRTTARLGMRFRENKRLEDVPASLLASVCAWISLPDEEMRSACLDFIFQYSSVSDNVENLIYSVQVPKLVSDLTRLLLSDAREVPYKSPKPRRPAEEEAAPTLVPRLAVGLIEQLLEYEEPERSSHWLRMCFEDDPNAEMTQIDLWKSYQGTFLTWNISHPHLIAGDFIKNVSATFTGASAQVAGTKYVIRGIKPRATPVDYRGRELLRCQWHAPKKPGEEQTSAIFAYATSTECGQFFPNGKSLFEHILAHHLDLPRKMPTPPAGDAPAKTTTLSMIDFSAKVDAQPAGCTWSTCNHKVPNNVTAVMRWFLLARHVETHIPEEQQQHQNKEQKQNGDFHESDHHYLNTALDESLREPVGVPLGAAMCLKNISRSLSKMADEGENVQQLLKHIQGRVGRTTDEEKEDEEEEEPELEAASGREKEAEGEEEESQQVLPPRPNANSSKAKLVRRIFGPVKERLIFVMGHNQVLKERVGDVLRFVSTSGAL